MAKKSVNKSAVVRDYLAKYPEKGPAAIAQQINQEKGIKLSGNFVATVKTKLKQAPSSPPPPPNPPPPPPPPKKKNPPPASVKPTATKPASAPASAAGLSQHNCQLEGSDATAG